MLTARRLIYGQIFEGDELLMHHYTFIILRIAKTGGKKTASEFCRHGAVKDD